MKSLNKLLLFIAFSSLFLLVACQSNKNDTASTEEQMALVVESYLENLKNGNPEEAVKNVLFTEAEMHAGIPAIFCDAMEGYDYKTITINDIVSLNESVYIVHAIVNTNFGNKDKTEYIDEEFNPFIFYHDDRYMLALIREQVPINLYEKDFETLPYNYEGEPEYMVIDEDYSFFY